ncbi:copper resistance protein CopC [Arthrobacter sp. SO3]|uniref:copper resistance CopC family protein n=1 Tax=Arthrobacter sp. SO3 TaxID=1897057 RepID=UPI001CFF7710|nr:copper resistance CopC family protein [Arthrobacter sp. SO3]MCB5292832.1 Copper resistance protein C [Arthrobacter sp. SO3]
MRLIRQFLSALLGAAILAVTLLGAVAPASAHDVAESTSPASGATVATPPEKVSVTFNRNPLALGSQIVVSDAAGTNWADGAVEIVDNVAAQKLKPGAPAGLYTVTWRVASSDGHPIEGSFTFTAAAAAGAGATAAAAVPTMGTAQPGITPAPSTPASSAEPFPWSIVIFVGTAIGILVVLGLMAKSRLKPGPGDRPES